MAHCLRRRRHVLRRDRRMGLAHRPTFLRKKQSLIDNCKQITYNCLQYRNEKETRNHIVYCSTTESLRKSY